MNKKKTLLIVLSLWLETSFLVSAQTREPASHLYKVGAASRSFVPKEPYNWRGAKTHALVTTIWYPADSGAVEQPQWIGSSDSPFASAGKAAPDAKLASVPAKFPLILLSHGTGASSLMMAWMGTVLASHGYIAAAVNHPGNNAVDGYTVQGFSLWGERATDLSAVIDQILADSTFGPRIDSQRIGAAGFSLGGCTMLEIAGGIGELSRYEEFCKSPRADGMCVDPAEFPNLLSKAEEFSKTDPEFQAALREAGHSHRDPRIRAVFAIAPAIGPAFDPKSLEEISIPVEIVAGAEDTVVPPATSAKFFAARIKGAKLTLFPAVGHYTFLATCADFGKKARPDLCNDARGVDRDAIHAKTAAMAVSFLAANLK
jgi:predicted dienelactone hydrolase